MLEHVEGHDSVISDVRESSERRMKAEAKKPNKTHGSRFVPLFCLRLHSPLGPVNYRSSLILASSCLPITSGTRLMGLWWEKRSTSGY